MPASFRRILPLMALLGVIGCHKSIPAPVSENAIASAWFRDITAESGIDFVHDAGPTGSFSLPQTV